MDVRESFHTYCVVYLYTLLFLANKLLTGLILQSVLIALLLLSTPESAARLLLFFIRGALLFSQ